MNKNLPHLIQGQAIYRFSPALNKKGKSTRRDGKNTKWWLILECDREIGRYLRYLYASHTHQTKVLQEPLWGTHISVIRDEAPLHPQYWEMLEGQSVDIQYSMDVTFYQRYAVVEAFCEPALDYREQLGLPREPAYPLHLTIGNLPANLK